MHTDPLRNTLDHLALDPAAKDERRYLVSMLRRLGYTEREIEEALGPEPGRVIEIEYRPGQPRGQGSFAVVQDWQEAPEEVGFSVARQDDDPALAHGWIVADEPVAFEERPAEPADWQEWDDGASTQWPEQEAWETEAWPEEDQAWPEPDPAGPQEEPGAAPAQSWAASEPMDHEAEQEPPAAPSTDDLAWHESPQIESQETVETEAAPPQAAPSDSWAAEDEAAWAAPASQDQVAWAQEASASQDEASAAPADETAWASQDETAWASQDETAWASQDETAWAEAGAAGPADQEASAASETAEPADREGSAAAEAAWASPDYAVTKAPADAWSPADQEPFTYGEYTLHTRQVELGADREQRIYFFAKGQPKSGEPCPLPEGYVVEENDRTGLPFLRRDGGQTSSTCMAITQAGTQCRNAARDTSKYCAVHHGWRGAKAQSQAS